MTGIMVTINFGLPKTPWKLKPNLHSSYFHEANKQQYSQDQALYLLLYNISGDQSE